jgi:hypothetical protein
MTFHEELAQYAVKRAQGTACLKDETRVVQIGEALLRGIPGVVAAPEIAPDTDAPQVQALGETVLVAPPAPARRKRG